jgi:hypothetical protein
MQHKAFSIPGEAAACDPFLNNAELLVTNNSLTQRYITPTSLLTFIESAS